CSEEVASLEYPPTVSVRRYGNALASTCSLFWPKLLWSYRRGRMLTMVAPASPALQSEQVGDVVLVSFTDRELLDEWKIQKLGDALLSLAARVERRQLVVSLGGVERLSTMMLGKLMALHKRLKERGGRLALCRIDPRIDEIFRIFNFRRLLPIYQEEQDA